MPLSAHLLQSTLSLAPQPSEGALLGSSFAFCYFVQIGWMASSLVIAERRARATTSFRARAQFAHWPAGLSVARPTTPLPFSLFLFCAFVLFIASSSQSFLSNTIPLPEFFFFQLQLWFTSAPFPLAGSLQLPLRVMGQALASTLPLLPLLLFPSRGYRFSSALEHHFVVVPPSTDDPFYRVLFLLPPMIPLNLLPIITTMSSIVGHCTTFIRLGLGTKLLGHRPPSDL